jgi:hypothetical protein
MIEEVNLPCTVCKFIISNLFSPEKAADRVEEQLKQDGAEFTRHAHINEEADGGVEQRQQLNTVSKHHNGYFFFHY